MISPRKRVNIQIGVFIPAPSHELLISSVCSYFGSAKKDLLSKAKNREHARQKDMLYLLLKNEAQIQPKEISRICETTRQNVDRAILKMEAETSIYLQSACDYRNIKSIFETLQKQQECLISPKSSIRH